LTFASYGASHGSYPVANVTVACAIGVVKEQMDLLMKRLDKTFSDFIADRDKGIEEAELVDKWHRIVRIQNTLD